MSLQQYAKEHLTPDETTKRLEGLMGHNSELKDLPPEFWLRPLGARLVVQYDPFFYKGLLEIPDTAKRLGTTGRILALGPDVDKTIFTVGQRVVWATFSGTQFKFQDKDPFLILSVDEVLAVIKDGVGELKLEYSSAG